jgi:phosphoribosylformimino-5-aminoimidazole carboxamide ribotide isomerase
VSLTIFVAIDILDGKVVRLTRGKLNQVTVYADDPVKTALKWQEEGAGWLHVVDLNGAIGREQQGSGGIDQILSEAGIPIQVSGGIRSLSSVSRWLEAGAARICIGTKALDPEFLERALAEFGEAIVAAVDARGGEVQISGWREATGISAVEAAERFLRAGVPRLLFTDIERDGTLAGPNLDAIRQILDAVEIPVIASGGVDGAGSIKELAGLHPRLEGIVVGKALYEGTISLEEAKIAAGG